MTRSIHILVLLAMLVYWSPVRSCVLQEWTVGASCHDEGMGIAGEMAMSLTPSAEPVRGCGASPTGSAEHRENCLCEQPKLSVGRCDTGDWPADLAMPAPVPLVLISPIAGLRHADSLFHPPDVPSIGRTLPLLN